MYKNINNTFKKKSEILQTYFKFHGGLIVLTHLILSQFKMYTLTKIIVKKCSHPDAHKNKYYCYFLYSRHCTTALTNEHVLTSEVKEVMI